VRRSSPGKVEGVAVVVVALAAVPDQRSRDSRRVSPPPATTTWTNRSWSSARSRSGAAGTREKVKRAKARFEGGIVVAVAPHPPEDGPRPFLIRSGDAEERSRG
jgi:hypothetical protein